MGLLLPASLSGIYTKQGVQFYICILACLRTIRPMYGNRFDLVRLTETKISARIARREITGIGVDPPPERRQPGRLHLHARSGAEAGAVDLNCQPMTGRQVIAEQA